MLYTVGHTESYDEGLRTVSPLTKIGRGIVDGKPYDGGGVWTSERAASEYLKDRGLKEYSVYGLDTEMGNTYQPIGRDHLCLINSCDIYPLSEIGQKRTEPS